MNAISYPYRTLVLLVLLVMALVVSACGGSGGATVADVIEQAAAQTDADEESSAAGPLNPAKATVNARSLRVRGAPNPTAEVVGGIREGEVYDVIGLSSDGEWVELAISAVAGGRGWVSANFVDVQGAITEIPSVDAVSGAASSGGLLPTPTPVAGGIAATAGTATVTTEGVRLRVRAQPSANAEIVGYVYDGEVYPVLGTSADGSWTEIGGRVGTDNLNGGWVSSEFLILN